MGERPVRRPALTTRRRLLVRSGLLAVAGAVAAGGLFVVAAVPPAEWSFYPRCQFHLLTGLHCPGCGATRSVHAALNGRLAQAFAYNPFAPLLLPVVAVAVLRSLWRWLWDRPAPRPAGPPVGWRRWLPWAALAGMTAFWVLRNVPAYPFTLLAPHELAP